MEKKKYDMYIKKKDESIDKITDEFHEYLEKRAENTMSKREKRGLKVKKRISPLDQNREIMWIYNNI